MSIAVASGVDPQFAYSGYKTSSAVTIEEAPQSPVNEPTTIDQLIRKRAELIPDSPLIAYPDDEGNWVEYTAKDLHDFADNAAQHLTLKGLIPKEKRSTESEVVALLGPSNLDYAVSMLALSRMGFAVLFLSTRLPTEAYAALLERTKCVRMVTTDKWATTVSDLQMLRSLESFPLLSRAEYTVSTENSPFVRQTELVDEPKCISFIIHSSGSTGFPKPILQTHSASLGNYAVGSGLRAMITTPLFHNSGISTLFRGITAFRRTAFTNASKPMTNAALVSAMRTMQPQSFHAVPYTLKLLAESPEGIEELRKCVIVITGGSPCPDELGDLLVQKGVNLVSHYGQTEMGQLMISNREKGDTTWNYLRPLPKARDFLYFAPLGEGQYECVVLDGLPTKVISNSDDPPNSYYTRDCFAPHATIENAWRYTGRLDDRLTLINGEKVLPVPMEGRIRQDELVHECVIFGAGRDFPGLLVIPSERAAKLSRDEFLDQLEPTIKATNALAEAFSQIPREMIEVLPFDVDYPRTDKGTLIRAASYKKYESIIDAVYTRFETPEDDGTEKAKLDLEQTKTFVADLVESLGIKGLAADSDFFAAGMDSLQAIMARANIMRNLNLGGNVVAHNVAFDFPSIDKMAEYLHSLANGSEVKQKDDIEIMKDLVSKYGAFSPFIAGEAVPDSDVVVLTGATGSLGAHVLAKLLALPHISQVYCLVRAKDAAMAMSRVCSSLSARGLSHIAPPNHLFSKIVALPSDLSRPDLGLAPHMMARLKVSVTGVIHSAWAVNFNLGVASLESCIKDTRSLLDLCLSVPFAKPARMAFISSVSAGAGTPQPAFVQETYVEDPAHAQGMGYARSKWVAEHVCRKAVEATGIDARVLRSGQIIGDSKLGIWNATEAIPLMIQSATTLNALPALDEMPSWIPVDACADATVQLSGIDKPFAEPKDHNAETVFHMQNPRLFHWTEDLLPALREAGLEFETVSPREWVKRLREGDQDPKRNPTFKLLDFFTAKYDHDRPGRKGLVFATDATELYSSVIASRPDITGGDLIAKCVKHWKENNW